MGHIAATFKDKQKVLRCPLMPGLQGSLAGEVIEGAIDLNTIKSARIEFQKAPLRQILGVKDTLPVLI